MAALEIDHADSTLQYGLGLLHSWYKISEDPGGQVCVYQSKTVISKRPLAQFQKYLAIQLSR